MGLAALLGPVELSALLRIVALLAVLLHLLVGRHLRILVGLRLLYLLWRHRRTSWNLLLAALTFTTALNLALALAITLAITLDGTLTVPLRRARCGAKGGHAGQHCQSRWRAIIILEGEIWANTLLIVVPPSNIQDLRWEGRFSTGY